MDYRLDVRAKLRGRPAGELMERVLPARLAVDSRSTAGPRVSICGTNRARGTRGSA